MATRDHLQAVSESSVVDVVQPDLAFTELPSNMWSSSLDLPQDLRQLHASLVDALRRDSRHIPSGIVSAMQCERIASYYIEIRYREQQDNWPTPRYREQLMRSYRELSNDLTAAHHSKKMSPEELHLIVSSHTAKIVANVLQSLPMDQAKPLYRRFAEAIESGESA